METHYKELIKSLSSEQLRPSASNPKSPVRWQVLGGERGEVKGLPFEGVEATRSKVMRRLKLIVRLGVWRRMTLQ